MFDLAVFDTGWLQDAVIRFEDFDALTLIFKLHPTF